ncbi:M4 family metallopeptidase [Sulfidibacter corallicola]|uniref:M4 family metallopeptidase n=1 Tax=Sulfidibacter corallicola TaxID=2818388 RepID=A0A8A4TYR7_SULCO|nr:M4 family metallopeptidase [Sulfidibacter corallicola]QTD51665.1 M4 family metallopeptidase [Sulfidibacter corallicola]
MSLLLLSAPVLAQLNHNGQAFQPVNAQGLLQQAQSQVISLDRDLAHLALASKTRGTPFRFQMHPDFATPRFMTGVLSEPSDAKPEELAIAFLERHRALYKLATEERFVVADVTRDELGFSHVRLNLYRGDLEVWPAQVMVHLNRAGQVEMVNGNVRSAGLSHAKAAITDRQAVAAAIAAVNPRVRHETETRLMIYDWQVAEPRLVYRVEVRAKGINPLHTEVYVDAADGSIVNRIDNICNWNPHAVDKEPAHILDHPPVAPGDLLGSPENEAEARKRAAVNCTVFPTLAGDQTATVSGYNSNGEILLINTSKAMFPGNLDTNTLAGTIYVLESNHTNQPIGVSKDPNGDMVFNDATETHAAGAVAYLMSKTYDWLQSTFNRNSYDGNGSAMRIFVNFRQDPNQGFDNAYWNNRELVFGDGGQITRNWAFALDFATHEICHAITSSSANLIYQFQSGALNESFSDMYATTHDDANWLIGEAITIQEVFGAPALRSMSDPSQGLAQGSNGWQPSHMNQFQNLQANFDNGGVHINSGIINQAYYQIAQAIGRDKAIQIMHRALTNYLTRNSEFVDARAAAERAAGDLYGDAERNTVSTAFGNVGIGTGGSDTGGQATATTLYYPFTAPFERYGLNYNNTFTITNVTGQTVSGTVTWYAANGTATASTQFSLNPHASTFGFSEAGDHWIKVEADNQIVGSYMHMTSDGSSWSLIPATRFIANGMFIPHVATGANFWTVGAVANVVDTPSNVLYLDNLDQPWTVAVNTINNGLAFDFEQDLYGTFPDVSQVGGLWGFFVNFDLTAEKVLEHNMTGAEIFGRKDAAQSAGLIMDATSGRNLLFTHVAADTSTFWTGYSIVNLTGESSAVNFLSFNDQGQTLANQVVNIGPFGKLLAVTGDSLVPTGTSWFMVLGLSESTSLAGMELFGTLDNRSLAGFQATPNTSKKFYFPFVISGSVSQPTAFANLPAMFTGISVINPNSAPANITIRVYNHEGGTAAGTATLQPGNKLLGLLQTLLNVTNFYGYVEVESDLPVAGFSLSGYLNGQELAANPMVSFE